MKKFYIAFFAMLLTVGVAVAGRADLKIGNAQLKTTSTSVVKKTLKNAPIQAQPISKAKSLKGKKVTGMRKADANTTSIEGTWTFTLGDYYINGVEYTADFEATLEDGVVYFEDPEDVELPFIADFNESTGVLTFNREYLLFTGTYYVCQMPFVWNYVLNDFDYQSFTAQFTGGNIEFELDHGIYWGAYTSISDSNDDSLGYFGILDLVGAERAVPWTKMEDATFNENIIYALFTGEENTKTIDVELYESPFTPGIYKLIDPFKTLYSALNFKGTSPTMIIDATNPDNVLVEMQPTGISGGQTVGAYYYFNEGWYCDEFGDELDPSLICYLSNSSDGMTSIEFPYHSFTVFTGTSSQFYYGSAYPCVLRFKTPVVAPDEPEYMEAPVTVIDPEQGAVSSIMSATVTWGYQPIELVEGATATWTVNGGEPMAVESIDVTFVPLENLGGEPSTGVMAFADQDAPNALVIGLPIEAFFNKGEFVITVPAGTVVNEAGEVNSEITIPVSVLNYYDGEMEVAAVEEGNGAISTITITFDEGTEVYTNDPFIIRFGGTEITNTDTDLYEIDDNVVTLHVETLEDGVYELSIPQDAFMIVDGEGNMTLNSEYFAEYTVNLKAATEFPELLLLVPRGGEADILSNYILVTWGFQQIELTDDYEAPQLTWPNGQVSETRVRIDDANGSETGDVDNTAPTEDNALAFIGFQTLDFDTMRYVPEMDGTYKLHIPAGVVTLNGTPNPEAEVEFTIGNASEEPGEMQYADAIPENGSVRSALDEVVLTWDQEISAVSEDAMEVEIFLNSESLGNASAVLFQIDDAEVNPFAEGDEEGDDTPNVNANPNAVLINLYDVLDYSEYGVVTFTFPAGLVKNAAGEVNPAQQFEYTIVAANYSDTWMPESGSTLTPDAIISIEWDDNVDINPMSSAIVVTNAAGEEVAYIAYGDEALSSFENSISINLSQTGLVEENEEETLEFSVAEGEYTFTLPAGFVYVGNEGLSAETMATYTLVNEEEIIREPAYSVTFAINAPEAADLTVYQLNGEDDEIDITEGIEDGLLTINYDQKNLDAGLGIMFAVSEDYNIDIVAMNRAIVEDYDYLIQEGVTSSGIKTVVVEIRAGINENNGEEEGDESGEGGVVADFGVTVTLNNTLIFDSPVRMSFTEGQETPETADVVVSLNTDAPFDYAGFQFDLTVPSFAKVKDVKVNDEFDVAAIDGIKCNEIESDEAAETTTYRVMTYFNDFVSYNLTADLATVTLEVAYADGIEGEYPVVIENTAIFSSPTGGEIPMEGFEGQLIIEVEQLIPATEVEITDVNLMAPSFSPENFWNTTAKITVEEALEFTVKLTPEESNDVLSWEADVDGVTVVYNDATGKYEVYTDGVDVAEDGYVAVQLTATTIKGDVSLEYNMDVWGQKLGDSNFSNLVTVGDVVTTANYIACGSNTQYNVELLNEWVERFDYPNGNVVMDDVINTDDVTATVEIVMNPYGKKNVRRMASVVENGDRLVTDNFTVALNRPFSIGVNLDNTVAYAALQAVVEIPAGMTFKGMTRGAAAQNHDMIYHVMPNGNVNVVLYSQKNLAFGNEGSLFNLEVTATEECGDVTIRRIHASDAASNGYNLGYDGGLNESATTGIYDLTTEESNVRYFTVDGLEIRNPEAGQIVIRMEGGKAEKVLVK